MIADNWSHEDTTPRERPEIPDDVAAALAGCEFSWLEGEPLPPPRRGHKLQRPNPESETFRLPPRKSGRGREPVKWSTRRPHKQRRR